VGVEGLVLVELAVGSGLLDVDLSLRDGRIEAALRPCDLDGQERLLAGGEGQAKAEHQGQDLEGCKVIFDRPSEHLGACQIGL